MLCVHTCGYNECVVPSCVYNEWFLLCIPMCMVYVHVCNGYVMCASVCGVYRCLSDKYTWCSRCVRMFVVSVIYIWCLHTYLCALSRYFCACNALFVRNSKKMLSKLFAVDVTLLVTTTILCHYNTAWNTILPVYCKVPTTYVIYPY